MTTAAKVIAEARADLGMKESPPGSNLVPITKAFGKIPGYPGGGYGYPWCAAATSIWCKAAGLKPNTDYPHTPSTITQYNWAKSNNRWFSTPKVGDLVLYTNNRTAGGIYHVELVEAVSASSITTIGGNTSGTAGNIQGNGDGCYRKTISLSNARIYGYVRPRYAGATEAPAKPWDGKSYPGHLVRYGDTGAEVKVVQTMLKKHGVILDADADFGPATEKAVLAFQTRNRLEADGVVGPTTWAALMADPPKAVTAPQPAVKTPTAPAAPRVLKLGDEGADVKQVRDRLIAKGYSYLKPGTKWGPYMTVAVMDFQARAKAEVTGLVGPETRKALGL